MLVRTAERIVSMVRQYRPAVETYTWELPAGTLDPEETRRNRRRAVNWWKRLAWWPAELVSSGRLFPDTGRLAGAGYAFYVTTLAQTPDQSPRIGIDGPLCRSCRAETHDRSGRIPPRGTPGGLRGRGGARHPAGLNGHRETRLSILIPVYNEEEFVAAAIQRLLQVDFGTGRGN